MNEISALTRWFQCNYFFLFRAPVPRPIFEPSTFRTPTSPIFVEKRQSSVWCNIIRSKKKDVKDKMLCQTLNSFCKSKLFGWTIFFQSWSMWILKTPSKPARLCFVLVSVDEVSEYCPNDANEIDVSTSHVRKSWSASLNALFSSIYWSFKIRLWSDV